MSYAQVRTEIFQNNKMDFVETSDAIIEYSVELTNVLEWYNTTAMRTPRSKFDELCDEIQQKLIILTQKTEGAIYNYCVGLADCKKNGVKGQSE